MLPKLNVKPNNIEMLSAFSGVNRNFRIGDSEFSKTFNMTNDYFPTFGNRAKRGIKEDLTNVQGVIGGSYLSYVADNKLYYDERYVCDLEDTNKERQLIIMGALLVVFPDGVIYNTQTEEISYIQQENETVSPPVFTLCKLDGTAYDNTNTETSNTAPDDTSKYWIDTSAEPVVIKMYSTSTSSWVSIATTYVKVEATGIGTNLKKYDAVKIEDVDNSNAIYNNWDFNQYNLIYDCQDDFIVIAGLINKTFTNSTNVTVKRTLPEMDYVCELNNRIWGCSSSNHEIYGCKLGDPTNWNCFAGLDSDSYAATVGTEDDFTGCCAYGGYVMFFKEDGFHRLYGNKPSNYEMVWKTGRGVQAGSSKSICVVNELLMYKSRDAVCSYDGSIEKISDKLGYKPLYGGVAGAYRDKYFISLRDVDYNYKLLVYDITKGTWIEEDDLELIYAVTVDGGLYLIDKNYHMFVVNNEKIYKKIYPQDILFPSTEFYAGNSQSGEMEKDVKWSFETGDMGDSSPYHKYIKRVDIKVWLDISAYMKIEIMYDSSDEWISLIEYYCTKKKSYELPLAVQRCDHFKLRFSGWGEMRLYSIAKVTEQGSESNEGGQG